MTAIPDDHPVLASWEIDVDPEMTPQEAAAWALKVQRDPDSIATVFKIHMASGATHIVDLENSQ